MDNIRILTLIAFVFVSYVLWNQWQAANQVEVPISAQNETNNTITDSNTTQAITRNVINNTRGAVPNIRLDNQVAVIDIATATLQNDRLAVTIDANGVIRHAKLFDYGQSAVDSTPFVLLSKNSDRHYIAHSQPNHIVTDGNTGEISAVKPVPLEYVFAKENYQLIDGDDVVRLPVVYTDAQGITYETTYTLPRDSYQLQITHRIINETTQPITISVNQYLQRDDSIDPSQREATIGMHSYLGTAYHTQIEPYNKIDFADIISGDEKLNQRTDKGWVAILQHYFLSAWVTESGQKGYNFYTQGDNRLSTIGMYSTAKTVAANSNEQFSGTLYLGPKIQSRLAQTGDELDRAIDYGILYFIGKPLMQLLSFFYAMVGNWGVAIILLTIVVKLLLAWFSAKQYQSMARMRQLTPKIQQLKNRYGHDKQKMTLKMMDLYKKEKVNPLGGCLPILLQMPIFIALYWVLYESVELRHAPFMLWISDLSARDPWFVLPILMAASMYLMQKMTPLPATMDPIQVKVMHLMPVFMGIFFLFFPAGLVLYSLVNNLLSIAQQYWILRRYQPS